jgi:glycosyltransferase involved in cell wall biosynthesis
MKKKTRILYLGNKFFAFKKVKSVLETLEPLLAEFCEIKTASDKKNQVLRFLDMLWHFFRFGLSTDKIIIDVYSTLAFEFAFILGLLAHLFRKPYILFLHGGNLPERFNKSPQKVKWLFGRAQCIIAPSYYLADFFNKKGFQVQVIPNIIPLLDYPYKERKSIRPRILALRGFGTPYNPLMTLKAIHLLKDQVQDLKLLMLGNTEEYHYAAVRQFIQDHQLENIVEVRSKMPKKDWIALSKEYDIMVSNPMIDNTPVSLLEGMALGMCVVSTKVGGVPYLVSEKECALVDSDDATGLSQAILKILQDEDYAQQLSENGRRKAEAFDGENVRPLWENLLGR